MFRLGRSVRALALVLPALCLLIPAWAPAHAGQPPSTAQTGSAAGLPDPITINGSPLRLILAADSSIQVYHSAWPGEGQVFGWTHDSGDSGVWLWLGDKIYGPDSCFDGRFTAMLRVLPWTAVSHSGPGGAGTAGDPWVVTTVLDAGSSGVRVTQHVSYVNGQSYFHLSWDVANTTGSSHDVNLFHAVDSYFPGDASGRGYYDPRYGAVGGHNGNSANPWYMLFVPVGGPATHYMERGQDEVWAAIGFCGDAFTCPVEDQCELGPGLDDHFDLEDPTGTGNGFALQWQRTLAAGGSVTLGDWWTFGTSPLIPGTQPPTPVPTLTRTVTPAVSPTPTRTLTPAVSPTPTRTPTQPVTPGRPIYLPLVRKRVL